MNKKVMKYKAFTLIELTIVVAIILVIISMILPSANVMWHHSVIQNTHLKVRNLLQTARARSSNFFKIIAYGVLFYVDPFTDHQVAVFINGITYPVESNESWPDVFDRFVPDTTRGQYIYSIESFVRIAPSDIEDWDSVDLLNNNYRAGKHRNFFVIIFERGKRGRNHKYFIADIDKDNDGFGDSLKLPVGDSTGLHGGMLRDVVLNINDEPLMLPTDWGFSIYDKSVFDDLSPDNLNLVPYISYYLTRYDKTILLETTK